MADAFPTDTPPSNTEFGLIANTQIFQSPLNKATQTVKLPGELWAATLTFAPFTSRLREALALRAFLASLSGRSGRFELWDHTHERPAGNYDAGLDTPLVDGASQTGTTLNTRGWRNSGSELLWKGDYLEITASGRKWLFMVKADVTSDPTGDAQIEIMPALTASPADASAINLIRPSAVFMLDDDEAARWASRRSTSGFSFSATEDFS